MDSMGNEWLYTLSEASLICGMSSYGMRKRLAKLGIEAAVEDAKSRGGNKWRESDLRSVFKERFKPAAELWMDGQSVCPVCGRTLNDTPSALLARGGMHLDCFCAELNKYLIGRRMPFDEAKSAMLEDVKGRRMAI